MNYKTALAEQIDDMAVELDDLKSEIRTKRTLYLDLLEERDSLVIEVNELTSTNKELWTTIKSLPTIAEDELTKENKR